MPTTLRRRLPPPASLLASAARRKSRQHLSHQGWAANRIARHSRSSALLLILNRSPTLVWIEPINLLGQLQSIRSKILLIDHAVLAHHKGLDASDAVLRRSGDQREAADHRTIHQVVQLAQGRRWSLALQDLEEVSVIGF